MNGEEPISPPREGSLVKAAVAVAGTRALLVVIGTVVSIVIARALGPAGRGQYAFAVAIAATAVSLAHLSVEQSQVYLTSTGTALRRLAGNALALSAGLGAIAMSIIALGCFLIGYPSTDLWSDGPLLLALAGIPLNIAVLYTNGLLVLAGRTDLLNRGMLLAGVAQGSLIVLFAVTGTLTVTVVVAAWLLNAALPLCVALPALRPRLRDASWTLARSELATGLRYHGGLASLYLLLRADVLLIAALRGDRDLGLYALAVAIIELTNIATDAVATVVVRRQVSATMEESAKLTARVIGLTTVLAAAAVLALVAAAPLLVPLLYGGDFRGAVPALYALAPGVLALAAVRSAGGYLIRLNKPWTTTWLALAALVVNVLGNLLLIPPLGIVGAGVASSVAYLLLAGSYLAWFVHRTDVPLRSFRPQLAQLRKG